MRKIRSVVGVHALALAVGTLALAGCGDSDSGSDASTQPATNAQGSTSTGTASPSKSKAGDAAHKGASPEAAAKNGAPEKTKLVKNFKVIPVHVSGGGSGPLISKDWDNSIQEYGEEADESELAEAAEALHSYYVAVSQNDWATACSYLAKEIKTGLGKLSAKSGGQKMACEEASASLYRQRTAKERTEFTKVDALSLRREGDQAFLIYRGPEYDTGSAYGASDLYSMTLRFEDGAWKLMFAAGNQMGMPKSLVGH